jgi:hypothetical protein
MSSAASPFNTPLEAGIRLVILLAEAFPRALSLDHRLAAAPCEHDDPETAAILTCAVNNFTALSH